MKRWYFDYNGKRYYTGQVILLKTGFNITENKPIITEAVFVRSETKSGRYTYKEIGNLSGSNCVPFETFQKQFAGVVDGRIEPRYVEYEYNEWYQRNKKLTFLEELEVEGMCGAWITYILAMLASLVCKEWYCGWLLASVIFWGYRYKKLEERKDK
jgi:hypothetical protein